MTVDELIAALQKLSAEGHGESAVWVMDDQQNEDADLNGVTLVQLASLDGRDMGYAVQLEHFVDESESADGEAYDA